MIVRQFLQWVRQAPPGERAEATSALARAYLYSDLSPDDLAAAEGAMIMLLDDPSPLVRRALSEVFTSCEQAPQVVVHALAADQPDVALPVLEFSPLLREDDLVDLIATGRAEAQIAVAKRCLLTRGAAAAMAEVGEADACLALLENPVAADTSYDEVAALVRYFRQSGQLTAGMLLRALLSGNVVLFEEALAELSGISIDRVTAYIHDKNISGFRALYREAGLPDTAYPAFREALAAMRAGFLVGEQGGAARLKRRMVERVLGACAMNAGRTLQRSSPCCGALPWKRRARRLGCSAMTWWRKPQFFRPTNRMSRSIWRRRSRYLRVAYSGTIEGPLSWSRTSERPRFSCRRNSPVTSCRRLVNVAASSLASERAYSR
jgi:uncharacterized protein (DUF2336 family)